MPDAEPGFDARRVPALLGKHTVIGLIYCDPQGAVVKRVQLHGDIVRIDEQHVTIKLRGSGAEFTLPSDLAAFVEAPAGEYTFRGTGEVIINPDLMTQWTIQELPSDE